MKYNLILIVAFAILLTLSSCSDKGPGCAPDRTEYFFIKPEEKAVLPYKGFDTIKMKHSSGAIHTFIAGPLDSGYNITARATSPDCANNIFEYRQGYKISFSAVNYKSPIIVSLTNAYTSGSAELDIIHKNGITFNTIATLDFPPPPSPRYDFDSLLINGKMYYSIQLIYQDDNDHSEKLFYNSKFGILKFDYSDGETWERIHN
jgi:hypothetical protein